METVNQEEKVFTQSELDRIVTERLARDRAKYADYEELKVKADKFDKLDEANKTELQKATERAKELEAELNGLKKATALKELREKVAQEAGVPASLLTGEDEDTLKAQAKSILDFAKPSYPKVKDGGEPINTKGKATRDQFADWLNNQ